MEYLFHEHIRCSRQIGVVARKPLIHSIAECSDPVPACTRGSQSSTTNVAEMILLISFGYMPGHPSERA